MAFKGLKEGLWLDRPTGYLGRWLEAAVEGGAEWVCA